MVLATTRRRDLAKVRGFMPAAERLLEVNKKLCGVRDLWSEQARLTKQLAELAAPYYPDGTTVLVDGEQLEIQPRDDYISWPQALIKMGEAAFMRIFKPKVTWEPDRLLHKKSELDPSFPESARVANVTTRSFNVFFRKYPTSPPK